MRAFVIDAFTSVPFGGNSAGVILLDRAADEEWMQHVAAELKHPETAFVRLRADGAYDLRWFTPTVEVRLCGHATLASTHALHSTGAGKSFVFHTLSGELRTGVDESGVVSMDFPAAIPKPIQAPAGLAEALGAEPVSVHRAGEDVLVELAGVDVVGGLAPDIRALGTVDARGVIVTALAAPGADHDIVSRFFAPRVGVDEDPVTGSAHCVLAPFWAARLGRSALRAVQLSARGGRLDVEVHGDRVTLQGRAVTVLDGSLRVGVA